MSEELIPQGLPYGERQQYEEQARAIGMQVDMPGRPPAAPGPVPQVPQPGAGIGFDPLTTLKPTLNPASPAGGPVVTQQMLIEQASTSTNPIVREMAQRYMRRRSDDQTA